MPVPMMASRGMEEVQCYARLAGTDSSILRWQRSLTGEQVRFLGEVLVNRRAFVFRWQRDAGGGGRGDRDRGGGGNHLLQGAERVIGVVMRGALGGLDAVRMIRARGFLHDRLRHGLEAPDEAGPREGFEAVVSDVDL